MFPVPGEGLGVLAFVLAYLVKAYFDGFPVQDAVAAVDALPRAGGAQFRCGDRGLDAEAVQVSDRRARTRDGRSARSALWRWTWRS